MSDFYILTVTGEDKPGIVSFVTSALLKEKCNLGDASMMRLGNTFAMMLMLDCAEGIEHLDEIIAEMKKSGLRVHFDEVQNKPQTHLVPNIRITVYGADKSGIVSEVTSVLFEQSVNIIDLESSLGVAAENPLYILHIEGATSRSVDEVKQALIAGCSEVLTVDVEEIEVMLG